MRILADRYKAFSTPQQSLQSCFPNSTAIAAPGGTTAPGESPYFQCSSAVDAACPDNKSVKDCTACTAKNAAKLQAAGCTSDMLPHACAPNLLKCYGAVEANCPHHHGGDCFECAMQATTALEAADCTTALLQYVAAPCCHSPLRACAPLFSSLPFCLTCFHLAFRHLVPRGRSLLLPFHPL